MRRWRRRYVDYAQRPPTARVVVLGIVATVLLWLAPLAGCAGGAQTVPVQQAPVAAVPAVATAPPVEQPVADGPWRVHVLARCRRPDNLPTAVENSLAMCRTLVSDHAGSDAIMELELCLQDHGDYGILLLTLGQLYLLAGQGEPDLLPQEGPAADVGDWPRNQVRLLNRAMTFLDRAGELRGDDGVVDYLRADVARARGDLSRADSLFAVGKDKCTLPRSVATIRQYQQLNRYPPYLLTTLSPEYPQAAVEKQITGDVVLDLLISPRGEVYQVSLVSSPDQSLTKAAARAARAARYRPAKVGRYPVWSWLQITAKYSLDD